MKPGNVFITEDGDGMFARVLDFGISQGEGDVYERTVIGTPEYMSPEQALGDPLDHRSDIYSVGVMLYELLAGYLPFEDADPACVLTLVVAGQPLELDAGRPDVPELCQIVHKAMARRAQNRYGTAREMQVALARAAGTHDSGRHEAAEVPARHARSEHPTIDRPSMKLALPTNRAARRLALGALALCLAIAGGLAWTSHSMHAAASAPIAEPVSVPTTTSAIAEIVEPAPVVSAPIEMAAPREDLGLEEEAQPSARTRSRGRGQDRTRDDITRELDF
jgi:serine/threonine-protein kinase